ncbi:T9SS type A sorting domain-containing protein [Epilithonimonas sp. UC225_85]|uniref:T9SS type A sorting domain-containing protein n=1 Tax=Epilithonimonas sp. UC225_85 TaxID=3350167 RepID=UPI0036D24C96
MRRILILFFVDWNHNGILDESNEIISEGYIFGSSGVDDKFTQFPITVPQNAINGNTRVRVLKMQSATEYSMFWPVGASGYYYNSGQAEDYTLNISGGIADPGCSFACPSDINANTTPGGTTAIVNYNLPFNCSSQGSSSCGIDYPGNNFENWMSASNFNTVANDFVIPAGKTLKIDKVIPHLIRFSYGATVSFYKDNNGKPGELIMNYATPTIESQNVIGSTVGGTAYETVIKLPQTLELTSGKYWVAINMQGPLISWETKSALSNGTTAFTTGNGTDWTAKDGFDGVFKVSYVCETPEPQVVLAQGLESGSAFPEGNTVVVHNLVYEGIVIDTCVFNVKVNKILNTTEVSQKQITFYPNPVKDILTLSYFKEIENVVIYDMSGKKVFSKDINRKEADINLSNLTSGTYILNAKISGESKSFKILKK